MASYDYIFYSTDESFNYNGPFGTEICHERGLHGFSLDYDDNLEPIIDSLEGFGNYAGVENKIKTFSQLKKFLAEEFQNLNTYDCETTSQDVFDELFETIDKLEKEDIEDGKILKKVC